MSNAVTVKEPAIYGLLAEFDTPERLLKAAEKIRDAGYRVTDAFTPFPVHGLIDALGLRRTRITAAILVGGLTGCSVGLLLQWWVSCITYPHIVGGKPFFSWPNFIPVIFECTVLFGAFTAFITMLARNGLPKLYHPVFSAPRIELSSTDSFFICVEARDPIFDTEKTKKFLKEIGSDTVAEIPWDYPGDVEN